MQKFYEKPVDSLDEAVATLVNYEEIQNELLIEFPEHPTIMNLLIGAEGICIIQLIIEEDDEKH